MIDVTTAHTEPPALDRILRRDELAAYVGVARSAIEEMIDNNEFPRPIRINDAGRILGWLESEIIAWQQRRKALRDSGKAPLPKYRPVPPRPELLKKNGGPKRAAVRGK
jgi:predicted DNA-binding transcriptional regulator AlpA